MIAPPMIQRTFGFTRLLGASSGTLAHPHGRLVGRRSPAPGAVGPVRRERALAIPAASLAGRRRPPISTWRAGAGLLRLGLIDAFLELLETRPKRSRELREPVRPEQDQHDDQDDQQFLRTKSKHPWDSSTSAKDSQPTVPVPTAQWTLRTPRYDQSNKIRPLKLDRPSPERRGSWRHTLDFTGHPKIHRLGTTPAPFVLRWSVCSRM